MATWETWTQTAPGSWLIRRDPTYPLATPHRGPRGSRPAPSFTPLARWRPVASIRVNVSPMLLQPSHQPFLFRLYEFSSARRDLRRHDGEISQTFSDEGALGAYLRFRHGDRLARLLPPIVTITCLIYNYLQNVAQRANEHAERRRTTLFPCFGRHQLFHPAT